MNERIEWVSERWVKVTRFSMGYYVCVVDVAIEGEGLILKDNHMHYQTRWDAAGRDALHEVDQCFREHGNFAPLKPKVPVKVTRWLNLYPDGYYGISTSKEQANKLACSGRLYCVPVTFDLPPEIAAQLGEPCGGEE